VSLSALEQLVRNHALVSLLLQDEFVLSCK
jgi:hypothetical protein